MYDSYELALSLVAFLFLILEDVTRSNSRLHLIKEKKKRCVLFIIGGRSCRKIMSEVSYRMGCDRPRSQNRTK